VTDSISKDGDKSATALTWALRYASAGWRVFPVRADKTPLCKWKEGATTDPEAIAAMWASYPHADIAWALPATVLVVDVDRKPARDGFAEFKALAGVSVDEIATARASTVSGGRHLLFATQGLRYNNNRVPGTTAVDLKTGGGYIVLPGPASGRRWLTPWNTPLSSAPTWLDCALKREPLILAPRSALVASTPADPWARRQALNMLDRACAKITAAQPGSRNDTRCRQCFLVGGYIARGDLDYVTGFNALVAASLTVAHDPPWPKRQLERWVAQSIAAGMAQPLPLTEVDLFMRNLRARMRERRPAP
jgi:hypothetical protein